MAETKRLFDEILKKGTETYDSKMAPLTEEEAKSNFSSFFREGRKKQIYLEKQILDNIFRNPSCEALDSITQMKLEIRAITEKLEAGKEVYKELFGEELK